MARTGLKRRRVSCESLATTVEALSVSSQESLCDEDQVESDFEFDNAYEVVEKPKPKVSAFNLFAKNFMEEERANGVVPEVAKESCQLAWQELEDEYKDEFEVKAQEYNCGSAVNTHDLNTLGKKEDEPKVPCGGSYTFGCRFHSYDPGFNTGFGGYSCGVEFLRSYREPHAQDKYSRDVWLNSDEDEEKEDEPKKTEKPVQVPPVSICGSPCGKSAPKKSTRKRRATPGPRGRQCRPRIRRPVYDDEEDCEPRRPPPRRQSECQRSRPPPPRKQSDCGPRSHPPPQRRQSDCEPRRERSQRPCTPRKPLAKTCCTFPEADKPQKITPYLIFKKEFQQEKNKKAGVHKQSVLAASASAYNAWVQLDDGTKDQYRQRDQEEANKDKSDKKQVGKPKNNYGGYKGYVGYTSGYGGYGGYRSEYGGYGYHQ